MIGYCRLKMDRYSIIYTLTILCLALNHAAGYKHVIFMHGIFSGPSEIIAIQEWLKTDHPGTNITAINLYDDLKSLVTPMWKQVDKISLKVQQIMKENHDGVHLLCYSQGIIAFFFF
ncbi:hypothetical protein LOTGIDRAFT_231309 [Lottia gigantea]|uniref:DUF676 domain-containing protein n=1 Tax=Lottia gigantea TaxID=225164 RepID=V4AVF5_LOTGI|nr:hypothetical protein LOTGIDRAFT_231309 [Lottia gigantea]ESO98995.1 hypothetical protein LOTGIDRAFT_231309 [Lottia gigantea]